MITSRLVVLRGEPYAVEIHLRPGSFRIGRAHGCYIMPMCAYTSRQHCLLTVTDELVAVKDVGSRNGTFVNGHRIEGSVRLRTGDVLQVGLIRFRAVVEECAAAESKPAERARRATAAGPQLLTVEQLSGGSLGDSYIVRWLQGNAPDDPTGGDGLDSTLNAPVPHNEIGSTARDDEPRDGARNGAAPGVLRRTHKHVIDKTQEDTSRAAAEILEKLGASSDLALDLTT